MNRVQFGHRLPLSVLIACSVIVGGIVAPAVFAINELTQGYTTSQKLPLGTVVSLVKNTTDTIEPSSTATLDGMLGIVVSSDSALLSVTDGTNNQVQVATSGSVPVLVSDINGAIHEGDHITASPISGVGMKANGNVRTIGISQGDMTGVTDQTYKDKNGKDQPVKVGQIPILVNVAYYFKEPEKTIIPFAVQNVANALAGRTVSTVPILISIAIFLVTVIAVVAIIYSMIRNGIISIGRNPLSQSAVYRNIIQMSVLVLILLSTGMVAIYLVLTKM